MSDTYLFTPYVEDGAYPGDVMDDGRAMMQLSDADVAAWEKARDADTSAVVTDVTTGTRWTVEVAPCGSGCRCAAEATPADPEPAPAYYEVVPLLFGPDYRRPESPEDADYWTVYARDVEGLASALADVRTTGDGLAWLAHTLTAPALVDVYNGPHGPERVTLAPATLHGDAGSLHALEFDVSAHDVAPEHAGPHLPTWAAEAATKGARRAADAVDGMQLEDGGPFADPELLAYAAGVRDALTWLTTGVAEEGLRAVLDDPADPED